MQLSFWQICGKAQSLYEERRYSNIHETDIKLKELLLEKNTREQKNHMNHW